MTITVVQVVARALRLCGQSGAPGRGQSTEEVDEAVNFLNQFLDSWSAAEDKIFNTSTSRFTLSAPQEYYTIGPSGADFTAPRPIYIKNANIVQTNANPEVYIPLAILDDNQFADLGVRNYETSIPTYLYYNKDSMGSANGRIYLIGRPNVANDLELFTFSPFTNNLSSSDSVTLPEGYGEAVVYSLAEKLAPLYYRKSNGMLGEIKEQARKARANVVALNSQAPKQDSDAPNGSTSWSNRGPYFNYLNGSTHRR